MKDYADRTRHTKQRDIKIGDKVIILQKDGKKRFNPEIYIVVKVAGSQIQARRGERVITRNSSFFKIVNGIQQKERKENMEDEYDIDIANNGNNNAPVDQRGPPGQNDQPGNQPQLQPQAQQPQAGRPVRNRRPPRYLNDYVRK